MTIYTLAPSATSVDWTIIKGADAFSIYLPVLDADNNAVTVDGWTAKAQVRRSDADPLLHEWSTTNGNLTLSGTQVRLIVDPVVTADWTFTDAQVSVVVYEPVTNSPHTIARGAIHALAEITQ